MRAHEWILAVEPEGRAGSENMGVDYTLLQAARDGRGFLRLYRWSPPCLSFGRHEAARLRYDRDAITRRGLATVRRPTGGRAVWHDAELTYAVAAPVAWFGTLRDSYLLIHRVLAAALRRLGAPVRLAPRPTTRAPGPDGGACFAVPVGGEVVAHDRKLVGSAQVREGEAFLQHGSVLLADGQDVVATVSRGPRARPAATSLSALLSRSVTFDEVAACVAHEIEQAWSGRWRCAPAPLRPECAARFRDPDWTWRR